MFRWLWRLLFESTPVEFRSAFGLDDSLERLRAATKRSVFSALSETSAVGKVSEKCVRLQRAIPMVGNSFKPFFLGRFHSSGGNVLLVGRFTMLPVVKVFMCIWFGLLILLGLVLLFGAISKGPLPAVLAPFVMVCAGVAMLAFGKWLARNDIAWLSGVIEGALTAPGASGGSRGATTTMDLTAVPMTLKAAAIVLATSGVMAVFSSQMESERPPMSARAGTFFTLIPPMGRWPLLYAALVVALALGVWRRRPWAWWAFFILLASSACWSMYGMYAMPAIGNVVPPLGMRIVFGVMCCVVMVLWGRWWYGQRRHFIDRRK